MSFLAERHGVREEGLGPGDGIPDAGWDPCGVHQLCGPRVIGAGNDCQIVTTPQVAGGALDLIVPLRSGSPHLRERRKRERPRLVDVGAAAGEIGSGGVLNQADVGGRERCLQGGDGRQGQENVPDVIRT